METSQIVRGDPRPYCHGRPCRSAPFCIRRSNSARYSLRFPNGERVRPASSNPSVMDPCDCGCCMTQASTRLFFWVSLRRGIDRCRMSAEEAHSEPFLEWPPLADPTLRVICVVPPSSAAAMSMGVVSFSLSTLTHSYSPPSSAKGTPQRSCMVPSHTHTYTYTHTHTHTLIEICQDDDLGRSRTDEIILAAAAAAAGE